MSPRLLRGVQRRWGHRGGTTRAAPRLRRTVGTSHPPRLDPRGSAEEVRSRVGSGLVGLVPSPSPSPVCLRGGRLLVALVSSAMEPSLLRLVAVVSLEQGTVWGDVLVHGVELVALITKPGLGSLGLVVELHVQRGAVGGTRAGADLMYGMARRAASLHATLRDDGEGTEGRGQR
jgi:hypothetical protein